MEWTHGVERKECTSGVSTCNGKHNSETAECSTQVTPSFTGEFEDLTIDCDAPKKRKMYGIKNENCTLSTGKNISTQQVDSVTNEKSLTKEENTTNLYVVGPEILKYQGSQYSSDDVAPVWKKDCRMWLWKGSHYSRKKRRPFSQSVHSNLKS